MAEKHLKNACYSLWTEDLFKAACYEFSPTFCFAIWSEAVMWKTQPLFQGSWHYSPKFHGALMLLNISFHFTEKVTDWLWVSLTSVCTWALCARTSANCKIPEQFYAFFKIQMLVKDQEKQLPCPSTTPVQQPVPLCWRQDWEQRWAIVFVFPFPTLLVSCLMRHQLFVSAELLRQSLESAAELTLVHNDCWEGVERGMPAHPSWRPAQN